MKLSDAARTVSCVTNRPNAECRAKRLAIYCTMFAGGLRHLCEDGVDCCVGRNGVRTWCFAKWRDSCVGVKNSAEISFAASFSADSTAMSGNLASM